MFILDMRPVGAKRTMTNCFPNGTKAHSRGCRVSMECPWSEEELATNECVFQSGGPFPAPNGGSNREASLRKKSYTLKSHSNNMYITCYIRYMSKAIYMSSRFMMCI